MAAQLTSRGDLTHAQERATMAVGLARVQESRAAWTRADLVHCIGQNLPDHAIGRDQEHAWRLLEELTGRAIAGEGGEELCRLDAPEWPRVPCCRKSETRPAASRSRERPRRRLAFYRHVVDRKARLHAVRAARPPLALVALA